MPWTEFARTRNTVVCNARNAMMLSLQHLWEKRCGVDSGGALVGTVRLYNSHHGNFCTFCIPRLGTEEFYNHGIRFVELGRFDGAV